MRYDPERIKRRLVAVELADVYRIIRHRYQGTPLGAVPAPSRFSDPEGRYAVLYASESIRCSFWESVARNRFTRRQRRELPRTEIEDRWIVAIGSLEPLRLVDLRTDGPIRIAAPTAVAHDSNHRAGRALSAATCAGVPAADGFIYSSRFTGHVCVAVFDRAFRKLHCTGVHPLIESRDLLDALDEYEITLSLPPIREA